MSNEIKTCPDKVLTWKELNNNYWIQTNATVKCEITVATSFPTTVTASAFHK